MIRVNGETIFVKDYRSRRGDRHEMDSGTTERVRAEWVLFVERLFDAAEVEL